MLFINYIRQRALRILFLSILLFAAAYIADARPGGGHSSGRSSGGGGRSSSGGGSSWGSGSRSSSGSGNSTPLEARDIIIFVIVLFTAIVISIVAEKIKKKVSRIIGLKGEFVELNTIASQKNKAANDLQKLKQDDPNFSETLFLDFVQNLFYQYYNTYNKADFDKLSAFLTKNVNKQTDKMKFNEVVINSINIIEVNQQEAQTDIKVWIESNYTQFTNTKKERLFAQSEWTFRRKGGVLSLEPAKMQSIACPSCGAPDSFDANHKCNNCGTVVEPETMQWALCNTYTAFTESYVADNLVAYSEEQGTYNNTIFSKNLERNTSLFAQKHHIDNFNTYFDKFTAEIIRPTFSTVYTAWSDKRWNKARHLMSDYLYTSLDFWLEEYNKKGFTNKLADINVRKMELVDVQLDKYYETFTVRVYASCLDYTINDNSGKIIGGNNSKPRVFSEYWTFVRHSDKDFSNDNHSTHDHLDNCPACGAPADKISNAGTCGYCNNKLSTGEFSWILSRISQDEAYV